MQWRMTTDLELYANAHQSWRPAQFSELFPNDPSVAVDPMLHSSRGVSTDIGIRGTIEQAFSLDISGFYLYYGDRIGTIARAALGADTVLLTGGASQLRRNVGVSEHRGIEFYAELFAERILPLHEHSVSIFVAGHSPMHDIPMVHSQGNLSSMHRSGSSEVVYDIGGRLL